MKRWLLLLLLLFPTSALAEYPDIDNIEIPDISSEEDNNSGDNQSGDQEGSLNTNNQNSTVNSNNRTNTNSKTYNGAGSSGMPPYSAISPTFMSTGPETCLQGGSQALQSGVVGLSRGSYKEDPNCNRRRDAEYQRRKRIQKKEKAIVIFQRKAVDPQRSRRGSRIRSNQEGEWIRKISGVLFRWSRQIRDQCRK